MIVSFDRTTKKVIWFNQLQSKEEAQKRVNETTVWIDGELPEAELREGYNKVFYVNDDMQAVRVEYEAILEPELTINEKIYEAVSKSQDELRQEGADMVMEEMQKRGLIV